MKAVVRKGWLDTRKKDVYLFEHSVGSAIAKFTAHYNVPFQGEGLANQLHANLIQHVATRFGSEASDRKLTEELLEFVKRERYTNEALTQSILKPEHGRQRCRCRRVPTGHPCGVPLASAPTQELGRGL